LIVFFVAKSPASFRTDVGEVRSDPQSQSRRALGIVAPPMLLGRADDVIE
jgi:hypothetical protein